MRRSEDQMIDRPKSMGWVSGLCVGLVLTGACGSARSQENRHDGPLRLEDEVGIDPGVESSVDANTRSASNGAEGRMDVELFQDDSSTFSSFGGEKPMMAMTRCWPHGDTTTVLGFIGMFAKSGYRLDLVKNRFHVSYFTGSDVEMYKLNKADSALSLGIEVPAVGAKVVLAKMPEFHIGDEIAGRVDLLSEDFYEVGNRGETKSRIRLKAYFKVTVSPNGP